MPFRTALAALLAAGAGALAVLAFPPFGLSTTLVVALAILYGLVAGRRPREGFLIGWAFGIGLLGVGIFWIRISLNEFGNMGTMLAYALTLLRGSSTEATVSDPAKHPSAEPEKKAVPN